MEKSMIKGNLVELGQQRELKTGGLIIYLGLGWMASHMESVSTIYGKVLI